MVNSEHEVNVKHKMLSEADLQDDNIELLEIASTYSNSEDVKSVQSSTRLLNFKKRNKVDSPRIQSPNPSTSTSSKISDLFVVKQKTPMKPTSTNDSKEFQSFVSLKSETQSYKEKLKERFRTLKKQAEMSVIEQQSIKRSKDKKRKDSVNEAVLQKEDDVINRKINKHEFKTIDNECNAYNFFCNSIEKETQEDKNEKEIVSDEDSIDQVESSIDLNEFLGINILDVDVVEFLRPNCIDIEANEKEIFKYAKRYFNKYFDKSSTGDEIEVRTYEEDGLFKAIIDHIPERELQMLEELLIPEKNRTWFGSNGELNILPDPRLNRLFKPFESNLKRTDFITEYVLPSVYEPVEHNTDVFNNILEIILHEIHFNHHPLFSPEHVLVQRLTELFQDYKKLNDTSMFLICSKKLDALRCAKQRLRASGDSNETQTRIERYRNEIATVRERMYEEGGKERKLKKSVLMTWKALKQIRTKQGYANTTVKLVIKKEYDNYENELTWWNKNVKDEVFELVEEHELLYQTLLVEYKKKLSDWKALKNDEKEKPKKPKRDFSEEDFEHIVEERCKENLKPPGEPLLDFDLEFNHQDVEDLKDKARRSCINKTQIFVKILCNKHEICKSKFVNLNEKFVCQFNEQISIKVYKLPQFFTMEIYEQTSTISKRLLAEIHCSIPDFQSTFQNSEIKQKQFSNSEISSYNHSAVGTGLTVNDVLKAHNLTLNDNKELKLFCNGYITFRFGWAFEQKSKSFEEQSTNVLVPKLFDIENLEELIRDCPDPQDPQNAFIFDYIHLQTSNFQRSKDYFRFEPGMKPFEFCTTDDLNSNPRFRLLKLRFNNEPEFQNLIVPNRIKEIMPAIFESYEKRLNEELNEENLPEEFDNSNIEARRKWAETYLKQVENKIVQLTKAAEKKITLKNVLNEHVIPSIGSLGLTFTNWFHPKRPLRPTRRPVKQMSFPVVFKDFRIIVNIVGAFQVPVRIEPSGPNTEQIILESVRPFIVVRFQDNVVRTTVAEGPNPVWNQELILTLKNTGGTITSLESIKDVIVFDLYDETVEDLVIDDRMTDTNIHQQFGCNWLGRMEIQFSALLYSNKIEGNFMLHIPPVIFGYQKPNIQSFQTIGDSFTQQKLDTFITFVLILQPAIENVRHKQNELKSTELQYVEEHITNWQNKYNMSFPRRQFSTLVTNTDGERSCITRYFKQIQLPQLDGTPRKLTKKQCARYVSLIPFRETFIDIWLTPEQLLNFQIGSITDHAVLLTCYFITLGLKAWLLLGFGMPNGYTAYVLIREHNNFGHIYSIYDVKTAQKYRISDSTCPLQKVYCVVNDENVWGNIQKEERIHLTKFDFTKSSDWLQLFDRTISAPVTSQRYSNASYHDVSSFATFLQNRLEKKLRKKIVKWRKYSRTIWNHYCNSSLKEILPKLELTENKDIDLKRFPELESIFIAYQIRGFITNFRYNSLGDIINFVQATNVHRSENENVEFSLAVYVHSYFNSALIVWLFIGTLVKYR